MRGTVGSTVHGLHLPEQDDRDEMAVSIPPPERVLGLEGWEHHVERTQPEGVRSGPGDLDLVVYGLRKYCRLALQGNPTVLLLLYTPHVLLRDRARQRAARPRAVVPLPAGRPPLPGLPGRAEGASAGRARAAAHQPAGARRGARVRHEVRDARAAPGGAGPRAAHRGRADPAHPRARAQRDPCGARGTRCRSTRWWRASRRPSARSRPRTRRRRCRTSQTSSASTPGSSRRTCATGSAPALRRHQRRSGLLARGAQRGVEAGQRADQQRRPEAGRDAQRRDVGRPVAARRVDQHDRAARQRARPARPGPRGTATPAGTAPARAAGSRRAHAAGRSRRAAPGRR